jgi:hypothetical protein
MNFIPPLGALDREKNACSTPTVRTALNEFRGTGASQQARREVSEFLTERLKLPGEHET